MSADAKAGVAPIPFNINWSVKVRLNERGTAELKRQHDEMADMYPTVFKDWKAPSVDAEGFATFQLWTLMHDLGPLCIMGPVPPFDTTIRLLPEEPSAREAHLLRSLEEARVALTDLVEAEDRYEADTNMKLDDPISEARDRARAALASLSQADAGRGE